MEGAINASSTPGGDGLDSPPVSKPAAGFKTGGVAFVVEPKKGGK
jgi:hypothetical protein